MRDNPTGGVRMKSLIDTGIPYMAGICIDLYNQQVHDGVFVSITTRIDGCNHYWTTIVCEK